MTLKFKTNIFKFNPPLLHYQQSFLPIATSNNIKKRAYQIYEGPTVIHTGSIMASETKSKR